MQFRTFSALLKNFNESVVELSPSSVTELRSIINTTTRLSEDTADYSNVVPISVGFAIVAFLLAITILLLMSFHRQMYTVNHLLIGNTCVWSIFYCCAQSNHFIYLLFVPWDTSDMSCRWRGFFAYLTITGTMYSYLLQALSRFFLIVVVQKYRWIASFKVHYILIAIQWTVAILLTLPAIITTDIFFRPHSLCWVTRLCPMHTIYTFIAYYAIPTTSIVVIYIYVYHYVTHRNGRVLRREAGVRQHNRDFEVFRNIMILFFIYLSAGIPTAIYIFTYIDIFYSVGIVFVSSTVAIEKSTTFYLDRELFNTLKTFVNKARARVRPATVLNT